MRLAFSGLCIIAATPVIAACPDGEAIEAYLAARAAAEPAEPLVEADAPLEDALCAQERLVERLSQDLGPVVGYKAGLTSPAAQEAFGVSEPVLGILLEGMLLEDGATVVAGEGVRPLFEADLIVEIKTPRSTTRRARKKPCRTSPESGRSWKRQTSRWPRR